jgi:hypothetical protein
MYCRTSQKTNLNKLLIVVLTHLQKIRAKKLYLHTYKRSGRRGGELDGPVTVEATALEEEQGLKELSAFICALLVLVSFYYQLM